jgi:hypothetical protein
VASEPLGDVGSDADVSDLAADQDLVATISPFQAPGLQSKVPTQQHQHQQKRRQKWGAALSRLRRSRSEQVQVKGAGHPQQQLRPAATLGSGLLMVTAEGTDADSSASSSREGCNMATSKGSSKLGRKPSLGKRLKQLLL